MPTKSPDLLSGHHETVDFAFRSSRSEREVWEGCGAGERERERERERVGLLLQLFPNGGATDIVFVTLFCIAVGTAVAWCCGRCAMPDGHCLNILLFGRRSTAAWSSGLALASRCHSSVLSHSSPSLIGLLASVDVKQEKSISRCRLF